MTEMSINIYTPFLCGITGVRRRNGKKILICIFCISLIDFRKILCYNSIAVLKEHRGVAQVVAHLTGGQGAAGSSPVTPTIKIFPSARRRGIGMWLSLVEHYVRDVGAAGSNPVIPTTSQYATVLRTLFTKGSFLCRAKRDAQ